MGIIRKLIAFGDFCVLEFYIHIFPAFFFLRLGSNGILSSSVESLSPLKSAFQTTAAALPRRVSENLDPARRMSCCRQCLQNYEQELAKLSKEFEKSSSEVKSEVARPLLPQWLHNAKAHDGDDKTAEQTEVSSSQIVRLTFYVIFPCL